MKGLVLEVTRGNGVWPATFMCIVSEMEVTVNSHMVSKQIRRHTLENEFP